MKSFVREAAALPAEAPDWLQDPLTVYTTGSCYLSRVMRRQVPACKCTVWKPAHSPWLPLDCVAASKCIMLLDSGTFSAHRMGPCPAGELPAEVVQRLRLRCEDLHQ